MAGTDTIQRPAKNVTCCYCGIALDNTNSSREHVVARNFVPDMKFTGKWNLILRACKGCNGIKSDLEDDIGIISMLLPGALAGEDPSIAAEIVRKARRCFSRRTRKVVAESTETTEISGSIFPGVTMRATMASPPGIDPERAGQLAHFQVRGFLYAMTYKPSEKRGRFSPGECVMVEAVTRGDWGNAQQRWFMTMVRDWETLVSHTLAGGYYKIVVRAHLDPLILSWGVEWNKSVRVIGFLGDLDQVTELLQTMPDLPMRAWSDKCRFRLEVPLAEGADILFREHISEPQCD